MNEIVTTVTNSELIITMESLAGFTLRVQVY